MQDDWEVNDHLTLNLGIRWDIEWNESYLDFVTPQFLLDSLNTEISPGLTYGQSLGLSSDPDTAFDINDYISTGNNREAKQDAFQPRLGFSYDIGADQRFVIFGGAGRAYDRTLYDYLQLEQTKFALATSELRFNTADHPCTPSASCVAWDPVYAQDPGAILALFNGMAGEVNLINNDLEVPYSDQFSLGLRSRLADWNTSIAVTRIESKDGFVFTLGNRYPNGDFWQNRSQPWGNSPPGLAGVLLIGDTGIETEEHAGAAVGGQAVHRGIEVGRDVFVHVYRRRPQSQHQRALRLRPGIDKRVSVRAVERGARTSRGRNRNVLRALGPDAGRASSPGRRRFRAMSPRACRDRRCSPTAHPARSSRTPSAPVMVTSRSTCRSPRTSTCGISGPFTCASTS